MRERGWAGELDREGAKRTHWQQTDLSSEGPEREELTRGPTCQVSQRMSIKGIDEQMGESQRWGGVVMGGRWKG